MLCSLWQAENVIEVLYDNSPKDGLFPTQISTRTGKPVNKQVTFGGTGDSFFEYLVKAWIQVSNASIVPRDSCCCPLYLWNLV